MTALLRLGTGPLARHLSQAGLALLGREPVGPIRRSALRALDRVALTPVSISAAASESLLLHPGGPSTEAPPCPTGEEPVLRQGAFPAIRAHLIPDAIVTPYASGVVCGDRLLLPEGLMENRQSCRTDGGGLFWLEQHHCIGRALQPQVLPEAISIGGAGAFNWYHFIIECLPKVWLTARLPETMADWPLLVPEECCRLSAFATALELFAGRRPIRYMARHEYLRVGRLVMIDAISRTPFNLAPRRWPRAGDYLQHDTLLRDFLTKLRDALLTGDPPAPHRRIFLVRSGPHRAYNQDELLAVARRHGFRPISPETHSLANQARLFAGAKMVVGASGAAWVGMGFCQPSARFLSWLPPEYRGFCSYSNLASLLGHRMEFLELTPASRLKSSGDASRQSYRLDPGLLDRALAGMAKEPAP